jgi:phosphomannomutase
MRRYPVSGEINRTVAEADKVLAEIETRYAKAADAKVDHTDGLSIEYADWRFSVRMSNTEPLLRLNVEARGDTKLLREKTHELLSLIENHGKG